MARSGDTKITNSAADLITLAESRLNRDLPLRVNRTSATLTGSTGSRLLTLPSDFVEPYALHLTTYTPYTILKPGVAGSVEVGTTNAVPSVWFFNGENLELDVPCDQAHTFLLYYRASFALSGDEPTNWLLTNHPDVYLFAALVELGMFLQNTDYAKNWEARYQEAKNAVAWKDARSVSVATLAVDPALLPAGGFDINTG